MNVSKLANALTIVFVVSVVVLFAELLFVLRRRRFFRPQSQTRVEPSAAPKQNPDGYDPVIDVFKMLEANGPSRVLCTIKEDDREEAESTSISVVDFVETPATERPSLQAFLESEAVAERAAVVEGAKTVVSSPCDSPVFFTPVGSPSPDGVGSEFVSPVSVNGCSGGR